METPEKENTDTEAPKSKKKGSKAKLWWALVAVIAVIAIFAPKDTPQQASNAQPATSADTKTAAPAPVKTEPVKPSVPAEYTSALAKADSYANTMDMSKQGVYDQLTSPYGEKFAPEAAQYAIDNVKADWNANALAKAKNYQSQQNMSPAAIHDQLVSEYGEKFTVSEADYAIQHLNG